MKKLLPIYILASSILIFAISAIGLICMIATVYTHPVEIVAVPVSIVALVLSAFTLSFAVLFKRDKLCLISVFVCTAALLTSIVSVVVWQTAL